MDIHGGKLKWKRGENDVFIISRAQSILNPGSKRMHSHSRWSKVWRKIKGGQINILNNYGDHLILLGVANSLS